MLCHWPGIYSNGSKEGFHSFQRVVQSLAERYRDQTVWMKLSEIARYWAAKAVAEIRREGNSLVIHSPIATPNFTMRIPRASGPVRTDVPLREVNSMSQLASGTWIADGPDMVLCLDLLTSDTTVQWGA
jgi:hypothetical protein